MTTTKEIQKRLTMVEGGRVVMPVRFPPEVWSAIHRLAKERNTSASKLVAEWTEAHMKAAGQI